MSVINNVLKDLENKPSAFTPLDLADLPGTKKNKGMQVSTILSAFILLFVVVAVFLLYFKSADIGFKKKELLIETVEVSTDEKITLESVETQSESRLPPVSDEIKKTEVIGLQMNESNDFLELILQLPQGARSFLKESSHNRYVFLISDISKEIIIPDFKDNVWLQSITIEETDAGMEIHFYTMDKVLVETRHSEKGQSYYWNIRLKKSEPEKQVKQLNSQADIAKKITPLEPVENLSKVLKGKRSNDQVDYNLQSYVAPEDSTNFKITAVSGKVTDEGLFKKAQLAVQNQHWVSAQSQLENLLGSRLDKRVRVMLLTLLKRQKKVDEMKILLTKSLQLYPGDTDFLIMDADLLFSQKQYLTLLKRYAGKAQNKYIINFVAASFQSVSQYDNAIDSYQRSLKIDPQQPRQWISLAISQEHVFQYDRARQAYQVALKSGALNNRLRSFIHKRLQQLSDSTD